MVISIGVDLVELPRVERLLTQYGDRFLLRLMNPGEAAELPSEHAARVLALAFAIALKEAASKALGTGWSLGVRWRDVVVVTLPAPAIRLEGRAAIVARQLGSSGAFRVARERRDTLVIGEAWLLT